MFERYTDKARRAVYFGRYEANQCGSPYIETEHLFLGILREDWKIVKAALNSRLSYTVISKIIRTHTDIMAYGLDLELYRIHRDPPLSGEARRVLAYAEREREKLGHERVGTGHLLIGIIMGEDSFASKICEALLEVGDDPQTVPVEKPTLPSSPSDSAMADLTFRPDPTKMSPEERRKCTLENIHRAKNDKEGWYAKKVYQVRYKWQPNDEGVMEIKAKSVMEALIQTQKELVGGGCDYEIISIKRLAEEK